MTEENNMPFGALATMLAPEPEEPTPPTNAPKPPRKRMNAANFIRLWLTTGTIEEFLQAAEEHGTPMKAQSARQRAKDLNKRWKEMGRDTSLPPKAPRRQPTQDYDALADLAASLLADD